MIQYHKISREKLISLFLRCQLNELTKYTLPIRLPKMSLSKSSPLLVIVICSLLIISGCTAQPSRGWSGAQPYGDNLYIGAMDGKVLALNTLARSQELPFPAQGEWVYSPPREGSATGFPCGFACAPAPIQTIYGTPVVAGELVYVGTYLGKIYALNTTARLEKKDFPVGVKGEWIYPKQAGKNVGNIVGDVIIFNNALYFGDSKGIYALDATTGDLQWHFPTRGKVWAAPAVKDNIVYAGSFDSNFYALSSDEGKELWSFQAPAAIASPPIVWENSVLFGAFDGYLYCIAEGKERWKFKGENWFWACPLVSNGIAYAGCLDGKIYALKIETGEKLWEREIGDPVVSSPVLTDDFLIVASEIGNLYTINIRTSEISKLISLKSQVMAPLYQKEGIVYVHAKNRYLYAVKIPEGEIIWKFYLAVKES